MPCVARPTVIPAIVVSSSGVSSTRSGPNLSSNPTVARNTPPLMPTSSPSTTTLGSFCISCASASVIASIRVISATARLQGDRFRALCGDVRRHLGMEVIEHRLDRLRLRAEVGVDLGVDELLALGFPGGFLRVVPRLDRLEI